MSNLKTWPEKMYFQWTDDDSLDVKKYKDLFGEDLTYCPEKINAGDVEYIRADLAKKRERQILAIFRKLAERLSCESALAELNELEVML
jgi:hypothetical protein